MQLCRWRCRSLRNLRVVMNTETVGMAVVAALIGAGGFRRAGVRGY